MFIAFLKIFLRINAKKFTTAFTCKQIILSELCDRHDHIELLRTVEASLHNAKIIPLNPHLKVPYFNLFALLKVVYYVFHSTSLKLVSLKEKLFLIFEMVYYCHQVDTFIKAFKNANSIKAKYIPLNSATGLEAILTLFFNQIGTETYHIFHGIFGRYKLSIANDVINGENITAQKILAFSETTKEDLIRDFGYSSDNIYIAGNPKYNYKKIIVKKNFNKCLVLNGFRFYDKEFLQLLRLLESISSDTGISFFIKPHPNSEILSFSEIGKFSLLHFIKEEVGLKELLKRDSFDFAITFNTVTYYECLYYNLICLRYSRNENINFIGLEDRFNDKISFNERISYFKSIDPEYLNKEVENLLIKTIGMGINNYNDIINRNYNPISPQ